LSVQTTQFNSRLTRRGTLKLEETSFAWPVWCGRLFGPASIPPSVERPRTDTLANPNAAGGTPRVIPNLFAIGPALYAARMSEDLENGRLRLALDGLKPRQIIGIRPTSEFPRQCGVWLRFQHHFMVRLPRDRGIPCPDEYGKHQPRKNCPCHGMILGAERP